jgi:hypothetical protein
MGSDSYNPHWATLSAKSSLAMKLFKKNLKPKLGHGCFLDPNPSSILGAESSSTRNKNPSPSLNFHLQGFERKSEARISFSSLTSLSLTWTSSWSSKLSSNSTFFVQKQWERKGGRLTCQWSSSKLVSHILELFSPSHSSCKYKCKIRMISSNSHSICTSKNLKNFTKPWNYLQIINGLWTLLSPLLVCFPHSSLVWPIDEEKTRIYNLLQNVYFSTMFQNE